MDKTFSRSRSVRYRSNRSRLGRSVCLEKTQTGCSVLSVRDDGYSASVVASEGGSLSHSGLVVGMVTPGDVDSVVEKLQAELQQARLESQKAAEYGLVLLEEKDFLQQERDHLEIQFEESQQEIDSLNQQLREAQSETAFIKRRVSAIQEEFVEECDEREDALVNDFKNHEKQIFDLKQSLRTECDRRQALEEEVATLRANEQHLENRIELIHKQSSEEQLESRELKKSYMQLRRQLNRPSSSFSDVDEQLIPSENDRLEKENKELTNQVNALSKRLDAALSQVDGQSSGSEVHEQTQVHNVHARNGCLVAGDANNMARVCAGSPAPDVNGYSVESSDEHTVVQHSSAGAAASRNSVLISTDIEGREQPSAVLDDTTSCASFASSEDGSYTNTNFEERERELQRQASMLRAELIAALTELDGLRQMSADADAAASKQIARLQEELELVRQHEQQLSQQSSIREEQLYDRQKNAGETEDVLSHLGSELRALNMDLIKVGRLASSLSDLKQRKTSCEGGIADKDASQCNSNVQLLNTIRQQVHSVKSALDTLVMQSLQKTAAKIGQASSASELNMCDEHKEGLQVELCKALEQAKVKTQESSQLRSLLKMARITGAANVERERTLRQQQASSHSLKVAALEQHMEKLRKDSKEYAHERNSFQARCDEFVCHLAKLKKENSGLTDETKVLDSMLRTTIEQKVAITEKLENYEFELQKQHIVGERVSKSMSKSADGICSSCKSSPTSQGTLRPSPLRSRLRFMRSKHSSNPS